MPTVWRRRREPTPDRRQPRARSASSVRGQRAQAPLRPSKRPLALSLSLSAQELAGGRRRLLCLAIRPRRDARPTSKAQAPSGCACGPATRLLLGVLCCSIAARGESEGRREKGKEKAKRKPAARAASGVTVVAIAECSGSSRRASAQGRAEPRTQTLKRQRPSTHLMRSQSEAKPPRARAGHGSSVVSRSRNAQQTADASGCSMTQRVNRDKTPHRLIHVRPRTA